MKNANKIPLALTLVLIISILNGCSTLDGSTSKIKQEPATFLAVIYSNNKSGNANSTLYFDVSAAPDDEMNKKSLIYRAGAPTSEITIFTNSGSPTQSKPYTMPASDAVNQAQADSDQAMRAGKIKEKIMSTAANAPESDPYSSLQLAANWLKTKPSNSPKYCLFIDNGICTVNTLSFLQEGFLTATSEDIVQKIIDKGALPDLTGVTVVFVGLGRTTEPQEVPKGTAYNNLKILWDLIVTKAGGTAIIREDNFSASKTDIQYPVTPVTFPKEDGLIFTKPWVFTEAEVRFNGDQATFIDPKVARNALQPAAEVIRQHPDSKILIAGTTATSGTSESCLDLSRRRAEAVKILLVNEFGVPAEQLLTVGLGFDRDPFKRAPDRDANGNFVEAEATNNRRVIVLDSNDPIAKQILGK